MGGRRISPAFNVAPDLTSKSPPSADTGILFCFLPSERCALSLRAVICNLVSCHSIPLMSAGIEQVMDGFDSMNMPYLASTISLEQVSVAGYMNSLPTLGIHDSSSAFDDNSYLGLVTDAFHISASVL